MALSNAFGAVTWYLQEDFESGQIPASWTQEVVSSSVANWAVEATSNATYPATGNTSNYYAALRNTTGMDQHYVTRLISPVIDFVAASNVYQPQLVFNHAQPGVGVDFDTLKVYYRVDANSSWTLLKAFSTRIDFWQKDTVALLGYTGASAYQIAFEAVENMGRGIVLDDISVLNASACTQTSQLEMSVPGTTSVTLTWNGDLMTDTFEVVLSKVAIVDWDNYQAAFHGYTPDFSIAITGLDPATTYFTYVRSKCDDNTTGWTDWAMFTFRTLVRIDVPHVEPFASTLPDGWTRLYNTSSAKPTFSKGANYAVDSTYAMVFSAVDAGKYAIGITPEVNLPSLQGAEVSFWGTAESNVKTSLNTKIAQLYVGVMDNCEDVNSLVIVDSVEVKVSWKHQRFDVSLANYTGNGKYIAFVASNPTRSTYFYLDSVTISQPAAFVPAVSLSNPTPDGFDINVDLKGATSWNLRIAKASNYVHKGALPASFMISQDGLTGNTYHVSGNYGDSIVAVYVQGVSASGTSAWSFPVTMRIPARATLPLTYNITSGTNPTLPVASLDNELRYSTTAMTWPFFYFPLNDLSFYPKKYSETVGGTYEILLTGVDEWATLPYIDSFEGQMVTFNLSANGDNRARVAVGIMSDPYDYSTFTQLAVFDGGTQPTSCQVDLEGKEALGHYVAIVALMSKEQNATGSANLINALKIEPMPTCRIPSFVEAAIQDTTVSLSWEPRGMNHWLVELFDGSKQDSLLQSQDVTTPAANFGGLTSNTNYYYQINLICGGDTLPGNGKVKFTTACAYISSFPWLEDFEDMSTGVINAACWENEHITGSGSARFSITTTTYAGNSTKKVYLPDMNAGTITRLTLPTFQLPAANYSFSLDVYRNESYLAKTTEGVRIIASDGVTETELAFIPRVDTVSNQYVPAEGVAGWYTYEFDIPVSGLCYIIIQGESEWGAATYMDNFQIKEIPTCPKVKVLAVDTVTATSAQLSWLPGKNETQWQYICTTSNGALDWANAQITNTPSVLVSGLGGCTSYTFYVRAYCSASDQSEVVAKAFTTQEGPIVDYPWNDSFEGYAKGNASADAPSCWAILPANAGSSVYPQVFVNNSSSYVKTGSQSLYFVSSSSTNAYAILPAFSKPLNTLKITFSHKEENASSSGILTLGYMTDPTSASSFVALQQYERSTSWQEVERILTDIPASVASTARLAFRYGGGPVNNYYMGIDDIHIQELDLNCTGLSSMRPTVASASEVSVSWSAGGAQSIDIEVSETDSFTVVTQHLGVTANPFVLSNLESNHHYYIRGRQSCDQAGDWIVDHFKTFCNAYTPAELGVQTFEEGASAIDCWAVGYSTEGTRPSDVPYVGTATGLGKFLVFDKDASPNDSTSYQDGLYAIMPELNVDSINKYEVVFRAFAASADANNAGKLSIGVITDPADFSTFSSVKTLKLDFASDTLSMNTYVVSLASYMGDYNDDFGKYIMFLAQSGDSANLVAIDNVEVEPVNPCPQITAGSMAQVMNDSAIYRWEGNGADAYEVAVLTKPGKPEESDPVFTAIVSTDSVIITGLSPVCTYYAYVRTVCGESASRWSAHTRFQTGCGAISGLPWGEDFDTYQGSTYSTSGPVPNCWTTKQDNGKVAPHVASTGSYRYTHSGSSSLSFYGDGNCYAALPVFADSLKNLQISFWYQTESSSEGVLSLGYIAQNDTAMETFTELLSFDNSYGSMTLAEYAFESIPASAYRLAFRWYCGSQYACGIDDVTVSRIPACKPLNDFRATKISRRYVTVQMTPKGATPDHYDLVCSATPLSNSVLDSVAKISVDASGIYTIEGLNRSTQYYLYARTNCGEEDGASAWTSLPVKTKALTDCEDVEVGTPTTSSSYLPTYSLYDYSVTQQIYTPAEVGTAGTFESIAFYNTGTEKTRDIEIYLSQTNKASFASTTDWAPVASSSKVFSGSVTFAEDVWTVLELSHPFEYDGVSNLLLVVDDNSGSWSSGLACAAFTGASNQAIYKYQDNTNMDPLDMSSITGTLTATKSSVHFAYCYAVDPCPVLTDLSVELIGDGTSEAVVRWNNSEDDYMSTSDIILSDSVITDFTGIAPTILGAPADSAVLSDLSPATTYYVYARANCMAEGMDEGQSGWAGTSFTTLANCPAVVGLSSDLFGAANAVSVSWQTAFAEQALNFAYVYSIDTLGEAGLASVQKHFVNDTLAFALTDLEYDQTYHIYVASVCGESFSPWSETTIKTDAACAPVRNLTAARVEHNRVVLNWNRSRFGAETQWEAGIVGDTASVVLVTDTAETLSALIIGLESETQYTAFVRTLCADGSVSEMTTVQFTTGAYSACVTTGSGTTTSNYLPAYNYYNYSTSQQIYTPAELGHGGNIASLAFYNAGTEKTRTIDLYLAHTSKNAFASATDWASVTMADRYFTGSVTFQANSWTVLQLSVPFPYNGSDNLLVVVDDNSGTYTSSPHMACLTYAVSDYQAMYAYNDNTDFDPSSMTATGTRSYGKNQIEFCFADAGNCRSVASLAVRDVTTNSAVASWEPMGSERSWRVYLADTVITDFTGLAVDTAYNYTYAITDLQPDKDYKFYVQPLCGADWKVVEFTTVAVCSAPIELSLDSLSNDEAVISWTDAFSVGLSYIVAYGQADSFDLADPTTYQTITVGQTSAKISGLEGLTSYSVAVKSACADALESRWTPTGTFTTECDAMEMPWSDGFEGSVACWRVGNRQSTSSTYMPNLTTSTSYVHRGARALQLYAYVSSSVAADSAYAWLPEINYDTVGINGTTVSFFARTHLASASYYKNVLVGVTSGLDMSTFQLVKSVPVTATYDQYEVSFANYNGTGDRIVLMAITDPSVSGTSTRYGRIYVDDIEVMPTPSCTKPDSLHVVSVTADAATFAWNAGAGETQWQYTYIAAGQLPDWSNAQIANTPSATLTGLPAASMFDFFVRAYCSEADQSVAISTEFSTPCGVVTLPFSENFNGLSTSGTIPNCWDNEKGTTTGATYKWIYNAGSSNGGCTSTGPDGTNCVRFNSYSNTSGKTNFLKTPDIYIDSNARLTFYWKNPDGGEGEVLVGHAGDTILTSVLATGLDDVAAWTEFSVNLNAYVGDTINIYFKGTSNYGYGDAYLYLDNVRVYALEGECLGLDNFHAAEVALSGATLEWSFANAHNNVAEIWVAADSAFTQILDTATVSNVTSYMVTGLQPSTTYFAKARQICGANETSEWTRTLSFTTGYGVPFIPQFTTTTLPSDWMKSNVEAAQVFAGTPMTGSGSWTLVASDTVINSTHFRGNIYGTSWHYWVVTPAIDLTPNVGDGLILSLDAGLVPYSSTSEPNIYTGDDDRFLVAVSIDGGESWSAANVTEWNNNGTGQFLYNDVPRVGSTYRINLSDYAGHVIKIGFYGESTVANADNYFHFGNIRLETVETTTYTDTICEGYSYSGYGFTVAYDELHVGLNAFSRYEETADGMSLTILQLMVNPTSVFEIPVTLCEGEHYNDYGFDVTATVSQNVRKRIDGGNQFGCDSTAILKITVIPAARAELHVGCNEDSYTWNGKTYYQSTIVSDTTTAASGCDSITTLYLTFCENETYNYHNAFCAGSSYSDDFFENLTAPGQYSGTITDEMGCETYANLTLHQLAAGQNYEDSVHVSNLPYVLGGDTLCPETDQPGFVYHGSYDFGCGMVNVTIYVYDKTALNNVSAGMLTVAPNPVRIGEDIKILTAVDLSSDYSCRVFDAVGKLVYETDEPSTVIPGLPTAGAYTVRIAAGNKVYQAKLIVK